VSVLARFRAWVASLATEGPAARVLTGPLRHVEAVLAAAFSLWYLCTAYFGLRSIETHRGVFLGGVLVLCLLRYAALPRSPRGRITVVDGVLILGALAAVGYWMANFERLTRNLGYEPGLDVVVFGGIAVVVSLEVARRATGPVIPLLAVLFLLYDSEWVAPWLPSTLLNHRGFPVARIMEYLYVTAEGMVGLVVETFATYVVIFVVLGAFLEKSGLGRLFIDLTFRLTGHRTGGPGLTAVASSGLFGMISGSGVANVVTTGTFTIPLMKRVGYRPHFAAAVEAAASTGGTYMPPIMGAGAFLLAEFTETSYLDVVRIAAIPAVLYFLSVAAIVYLEAVKQGLHGVPREELPRLGDVLGKLHYLLPIPVMLYFLLSGDDAFLSAFYAIAAVVILVTLETAVRLALACARGEVRGLGAVLAAAARALGGILRLCWESLVLGGRNTLVIGSVAGCLGIILGVAVQSGLPIRFSDWVVTVSQGLLPLTIVLVIVAGYVVGMGLPITASYVILAIFGVPALTRLDVPTVTAHLICFWVATSSAVTPPVALAAYAGAAIAKADPFRAGFAATKLASWLFLMPFLFVYTPILDVGNVPVLVWTTATALVGLVAWAGALEGYLLRPTRLWERAVLLLAALGLLHAGLLTDLAGMAILAVVLAVQQRRPRIARATAAERVTVPAAPAGPATE
jgi:TRAP transporter 4TM/12TM fusion protein